MHTLQRFNESLHWDNPLSIINATIKGIMGTCVLKKTYNSLTSHFRCRICGCRDLQKFSPKPLLLTLCRSREPEQFCPSGIKM